MSTVVLMGAPGSGKSTVGSLLAARLGVPFVDVDAEVERRDGRLIREIFAEDGEQAFRELERAMTLEALDTSAVVSLGGGAPLTPAIADALPAHRVVWLQVDARHAAQRIGLDEGRPLLAGGGVRGTLIKLLNERNAVYRGLATHAVDTNGRTPDEIAAAIHDLIEENA